MKQLLISVIEVNDMKTQADKKKFIELRSKGLSFENISQQLHISKPTLMKWNQEFRREIINLRYFEVESLIAEYGLAKKARIESFAIILEKALSELRTRSFDELSGKDLISMILQLDAKIKGELSCCQYFTGEYQTELESSIQDRMKEKTLPFVY
jgi:hypothetical protein